MTKREKVNLIDKTKFNLLDNIDKCQQNDWIVIRFIYLRES